MDKLNQAQRASEKESIGKIEEYKKTQKHIFRAIEKDKLNEVVPQYDQHQGQLDKHIETLRETLMDIEIKVQHALQEAVKSFTTKVEEINSILETLQKSTFD